MFKKITAATIVLSGLFASSASAVEVSLEELVGSLVSNAVTATKQELSYNVQEAVLTANNAISLDSEESYFATNVTITDLDNDAEITTEENDKAE